MRKATRGLVTLIVSVALVLVGCGVPAVAQSAVSWRSVAKRATTQSKALEPAGSPWKDWFVRSVLTDGDDVRLEDDFYTATNRDLILAYNADPFGPASVADEREYEIADQMAEVITSDDRAEDDLACLRVLYDLYTDWDARDEDGIKPVEDILDRLCDIQALDELTDWYCSDDCRLSMAWREDASDMSLASQGLSLFVLSPYNEVDGETAGAYAVDAYAPEYGLAPFCWDDSDVYVDGDVDACRLEELRSAATYVDEAYSVLQCLGFSKKDAHDTAYEAAQLEGRIEEALDGDADDDSSHLDDAASLTRAELEEYCEDGFPLDRIIDAYGYGDAATYEIDRAWLDTMNALYVEENLDLLVSHALASIALESVTLLDSEVYAAAYDADGDAYLSDELLEAAQEDTGGPDEVDYDDADDEQVAIWNRRDGCSFAREVAPTSYAKVYAQHFYDEQTTREVKSMVRSYVTAYEELLSSEKWISWATRDAAIEKLRAMRIEVGHPQTWPDTDELEVRSRAEGGTLFSETRRAAAYDLEQERYLLHRPNEGEYWRDCMEANAYYDPATNSVTIGMGFLGGAYWPEDGSYEERLAGVGTTIGHEISHAFDDQGAYFDKYGNYEQWWTDADLAAFEKRVERVQECFAEIDPIGRGRYDGTLVSGEAIADMAGLKVTMLVADEHQGSDAESSFDYDAFFRAYAHSWASIMSLADVKYQLANDGHPIDSQRANISVREVDEFYDTYDVAEDDGMWLDAAERISVW